MFENLKINVLPASTFGLVKEVGSLLAQHNLTALTACQPVAELSCNACHDGVSQYQAWGAKECKVMSSAYAAG